MKNKMIYENLLKLAPEIGERDFQGKILQSKGEGFKPAELSVDDWNPDHIHISLAHFISHHLGVVFPDPKMGISINLLSREAEAIFYVDLVESKNVYESPDGANIETKIELNKFLNDWISRLIRRGYE